MNGAGVQKRHPSEEFPYEDWEFVININLNAVFSMSQLAGQQFIKQNSRGKIINIASMLSFFRRIYRTGLCSVSGRRGPVDKSAL